MDATDHTARQEPLWSRITTVATRSAKESAARKAAEARRIKSANKARAKAPQSPEVVALKGLEEGPVDIKPGDLDKPLFGTEYHGLRYAVEKDQLEVAKLLIARRMPGPKGVMEHRKGERLPPQRDGAEVAQELSW